MKFTGFIALRYFTSKKRHRFISLLSFISVFAVAVGVFSLIVVISVMNGFQYDLRDKILGSKGHIQIQSLFNEGIQDYEELIKIIEEDPDVIGAAPFYTGQVMLKTGSEIKGAAIFGIDPVYEKNVTELDKFITRGSLDNVNDNSIPGITDEGNDITGPGIVLGSELAMNLGLNVGDVIKIFSPVFTAFLPDGTPIPKVMNFVVCGILKTGLYEYDLTFTYISLDSYRRLFNHSRGVSGIQVRVKNPFHAHEIAKRLSPKLPERLFLRDWMEMNSNLFAALSTEKKVMFIILFCIVIVAAFSIISTLIMLVMEKTRDIGILRAMGAPEKMIRKIFIIQGMLISVIGIIIGLASGILANELIRDKLPIPGGGTVYYIKTIPVKMVLYPDFTFIILGT
ncbi:MAG TPA: FtsX-like permease family protein, partial [Firmicutes bacterium]|nr:FtsX-like permease family protein [Bacillota bacterium]